MLKGKLKLQHMQWKPVQWIVDDRDLGDDYEVSNRGYVRNKKSGRILKPEPCDAGKLRYTIGGVRIMAHHVVATAWLDVTQEQIRNGDMEIHHKNGDRTDNRADNLQGLPHADHMALHANDRNGKNRYTQHDADEVVRMYVYEGATRSRIVHKLRMSHITVTNILRRALEPHQWHDNDKHLAVTAV